MSKRIVELFLSIIGLIILSPLFLIVAISIKLDSKGPIFFRQKRVGYKGKNFLLYKFRSMAKNTNERVENLTIKNDPRITKVGRLLRKYKIDEFPQLINILKNEMSFIGPRPELPKYVELFRKDYEYILKVKPGITDFASITFRDESELMKNGKNAENIYLNEILPQKIRLNKKYIKNRSSFLDLKLFFLTLIKLTKR